VDDDGKRLTAEPRGYRAAVFIPCLNNRCTERMQLRFIDANKNPLDDPYYLCQQRGCYYHDHPVFPRDIRADWITSHDKKRVRHKSNEGLSPGEGVTAI